ncbi:LysR family transcriptional regulator [Roseomonas sp. CCTCC AB2023176]|uniref:LysR family transcriptional regulator n=1 Tax=Roseomonas sp. CCTCC AB2023176 TaxID=3342640 RepID=UPI0035D69A66
MAATPDLNLLVTLVALVEERGVTPAARRLGVSQPAASAALARLRDLFRDELLVRTGRGMEPTPRALEIAEAARPHLLGLVEAMAGARPFVPGHDARIFRLGCTDAFAFAALPILSARLREEAPACDLVLRVGDYRTLPAMLGVGEVGTVAGWLRDDAPATAKVRVLRHAPWVLLRDAASPPVAGDLDAFCARPHALVTPAGDLAGPLDRLLGDRGMARRVAVGVSSFALLLAVLPGTDRLATVPDFVAARLAALGGLTIEAPPVAMPPVANALAWRAPLDRDPGEVWFRHAVRDAFAAACPG